MNYAQQIKHPEWQKKRLEVLELHNFTCQECKSTDSELHIHHSFYKRGAMIWQYSTDELQCLCFRCHKNSHALDESLKQSLSCLDIKNRLTALGYVQAMLHPATMPDDANYMVGYIDNIRTNDKYLTHLVTRKQVAL